MCHDPESTDGVQVRHHYSREDNTGTCPDSQRRTRIVSYHRMQYERGGGGVAGPKGEERRDHVYIKDIVEVIYRIIQRRSSGVINIASGDVRSFLEIAEKVSEFSENTINIHFSGGTIFTGELGILGN